MDFLKVLMLYMSLMFASSVQNAPPPGEAPEVTRPPVIAQVQQTAAVSTAQPGQAQVVGSTVITPDPNATPTPTPVPTVTPNPNYGVLRFGDKNNRVKNMQARLIELGYLKEGADDGSFGYQTLNAVRAFQRANDLSADGDAGSVTLTQLYENPYVIANPDAPTPTPTAAPITPDDPTAWLQMDGVTVLLDGKALALVNELSDGTRVQGRLHVWQLGSETYVSLDELAQAAQDWSLRASGTESCTLEAAGYVIELTASGSTDASQANASYRDGYLATIDGLPVPMAQADVVCRNQVWYASATFLRTAMSAQVTWEAEEMTLVLQVPPKSVAQSID